MPIYMDRHDMQGGTAEDAADAHRKDLALQDRYGVRFLTYWFDDQRGTTFCLVDAPNKDAVQSVHRDAHGHIPGEIVEVSLSAVEAFLGRVHDPKEASNSRALSEPAHRAIMFTDIVGSTKMTERLGDRVATEMVRAHDAIVRRCLKASGGREVKHTGDGIMASFASTAEAVNCAIEVQRGFALFNSGNAEPIHIRIGLDCGEPVEDSNDLFGSTVQLAARLCAAAASDQILASENIHREYSDPGVFVSTRQLRLKGFSQAVRAFRCGWKISTAG